MRSSSRERMLCTFCQARIAIQPFCPECGNPTAYASREERIQFELERWGHRNEEPDRVIDLAAMERAPGQGPQEPGQEAAPRQEAAPPQETARRPVRREASRRRPQPAGHKTPQPVAVAAPTLEAPAPTRSKERWRRVFAPLPDETVGFVKEGHCGPERATLVITKYRVAVVQGHRARWIPLENIDAIELIDGRNARLVVSGSLERIGFRHADRKLLEAIRDVLAHEARLGNMPGGLRHHPDVMQEWAERITEMWKAPFRTVRLWVHRHPAAAAVLH